MVKTRVLRKKGNLRSKERSFVVDNFKTPPSVSHISEPAVTKLIKAPKSAHALDVKYNVGATATLPLNHPLARCPKCKHHNKDHRVVVEPNRKSNNKLSSPTNIEGSIQTPDAVKILKQLKTIDNIDISPYVRNYLERKLIDKLKKTHGDSQLLQSMEALNIGQLELNNFDQAFNVSEQGYNDETSQPIQHADTPALATVRGHTRTIRRQKAPSRSRVLIKAKSSIDQRKRTNRKSIQLPGKANISSHQYFTRTRAKELKEKSNLAYFSVPTNADNDFFELAKSSFKTRLGNTTVTKSRTYRRPYRSLASNQSVSKAKTKVAAATLSQSLVAPKQPMRKSMIPRLSGKTGAPKRQ